MFYLSVCLLIYLFICVRAGARFMGHKGLEGGGGNALRRCDKSIISSFFYIVCMYSLP